VVTTDNESTFTSYLGEVTDNVGNTVMNLSGLNTALNGDYFYVGYSAKFYGCLFEVRVPNGNTSVLAAEFWNGSAWASFGSDTGSVPIALIDNTARGGETLAKSGTVYWHALPTGWTARVLGGSDSWYWIRFNVSAALSVGTSIREVRVLTVYPQMFIYRGRPRRADDIRSTPIIWEGAYQSFGGFSGLVTAMMVTSSWGWDLARGGTLLAANRQFLYGHWLPIGVHDHPLVSNHLGGSFDMARDDAGMPFVNKQWLDISVKGKTLDASHKYDIWYRVNENTQYLALEADAMTSPNRKAFSSVSGYAIQIRLSFDAFTHDELAEINEIEVRFRVLDTFKNQYQMLIELADNQTGVNGNPLPEASVQLTALEALQGGGTKTLIDPTGRSKTVTVDSVSELEYLQEAVDYPVLLVEVIATEI
jgi:hypothetical protein